jgi:hypothetical protein
MNRLPTRPYPFSGLDKCFVAGGAILSAVTKSDVSDYDIYPKSTEAAIEAIYYLMEEEGCFIVNISDRAITLKSNDVKNDKDERVIVQVMMFDEFTTAERIFEFFDFTVCMAAFDCDTKEYIFHPDFWVDVAGKTIRFNPKTRYPLNSMMRLGKYRAKGYTLPTSEMVRMSLTLMQSKLPTSWDELEAVIGGTYGQQVKLRTEGKEFSIQAAIDLFDDLNVDLLMPDVSTDYSDFSADDFEMAFSNEKVYAFEPQEHVGLKFFISTIGGSRTALITEDGRVSASGAKAIRLREILKKEPFETAPADMMIYGYKTFKELPDGALENCINPKKLRYAVGEWTEEPKTPHIYVHPKSGNAYGGQKLYKVGILLTDVVTLSDHEITAKKVQVIEKIA